MTFFTENNNNNNINHDNKISEFLLQIYLNFIVSQSYLLKKKCIEEMT